MRASLLRHDPIVAQADLDADLVYLVYEVGDLYDAAHPALLQATIGNVALSKQLAEDVVAYCPLLAGNPQLLNNHLASLLARIGEPGQRKFLLETIQGFADPAKVTNFTNDLANVPELVADFAGRVELVRAWEALYSKSGWRTNTGYLSKVARYQSSGLDIADEGGELIVKQADGVRVGWLDPNDPYYPGEIKVGGEVSGRHFDPDLAGGPIVKRMWQTANITVGGINDLAIHLTRFNDPEAIANNNFMIDRLIRISNGETTATDFDKRFYTHEVEEFSRFRNRGIIDGDFDNEVYQNAHTASLESYSINENVQKIYPPEVPYPQFTGYQ